MESILIYKCLGSYHPIKYQALSCIFSIICHSQRVAFTQISVVENILPDTTSFVDYDEFEDYCVGETFLSQCDPGEVVVIDQAFYGRMRVGKCIAPGMGRIG